MTQPRLLHRAVDAGFVVVLGTIVLTGLNQTYDGPRYLVVGVIGLLIGAVVALLTDSLRPSNVVAIGLGTYLLTCGPVIFPETTLALLPSSQTLAAIGDGTINGWWDILTTEPPLPTVSGPLLVPPFLCGLAAGLGGVLVARLRFALVPMVPVVALVVFVILFGTRRSEPPLLYACAVVGLTLVWGTVRHRRRIGPARTEASVMRRLASSGALLLVSAVAVTGFDQVLAPIAEGRYVLRDHVLPPFDPSAYPSPLSGFRQYEKRQRDEVLFTISGLPEGAWIRLATMDTYDGVVWNVVTGDGGPADGSGVFNRVGSRITADPRGQVAHLRVTVGTYNDIWLPAAGGVTAVTFEGDRAAALTESFRYNSATSVGVVPLGLTTGDTYSVDVIIPAVPTLSELAGRSFGSVTLPQLSNVPDEIGVLARDWAGGGSVTLVQLEAVLAILKGGAFSDGDPESGVVSPAGHGAGRLRDFLNAPELVGDDEQYAATLGLMARALGIPARVVLGAMPPPDGFDGEVTGEDISAWVEVNIDGIGWVPLDPTPPVESEPHPIRPQEDQEVDGQVLDPPLVQAAPPRPLPPPQAEEPVEELDCVLDWFCFNSLPSWAQWTIRYVAPPALAITAVLLAIMTAKALRWRRRRLRGTPVARVAGAWNELVDRLRDHGLRSSPFDTRQDIAGRTGGPESVRLATLVDAAIFGPGDPSEQLARDVWSVVPLAVKEVSIGRDRWQRFLARINPISLRPDPRMIEAVRRRRREARQAAVAVAVAPQPSGLQSHRAGA